MAAGWLDEIREGVLALQGYRFDDPRVAKGFHRLSERLREAADTIEREAGLEPPRPKPAAHLADGGTYCEGKLLPHSPLTHLDVDGGHYALPAPLPRVRCERCGGVYFA